MTRAENEQQIADRNPRQPGLVTNADGSVDLFFGPKAPRGFENNWIPTVPAGHGSHGSGSARRSSRTSRGRGHCRTS
ncbi:MAG TPA: DUF1214 domain-containing protein [Myxococcales bacterium]|nr:DUF1214 domain-containing protein [Myxococcales bacterium]